MVVLIKKKQNLIRGGEMGVFQTSILLQSKNLLLRAQVTLEVKSVVTRLAYSVLQYYCKNTIVFTFLDLDLSLITEFLVAVEPSIKKNLVS